MIEFATLQDAQAVPDSIHIHFTGSVWRVYERGDTVPDSLVSGPDATELIAALRGAAKALLDDRRDEDVRFRAFLLVVLDEFNRNSKVTRDLFAAIAAATSLADLKTRAGNIQTVPARTVDDLKTAVRNKIDAGGAD